MAGVAGSNYFYKRGKKNHTESLKAKNKELARALEAARKDVSDLFQENLVLKKERQELLERVASLECRLSQLLSVHSTQQSLSDVLIEMERKIFQAKSLLTTPSTSVNISSTVSSPIQLSTTNHQSTPIPTQDIAMETEQEIHSYCDDIKTIYSIASTSAVPEDASNRQRPRRACTSLVQSYQEPCLHSKLRRGDPFTENFLSFNATPKKRQSQKKSRQNGGLQDITNKPVKH